MTVQSFISLSVAILILAASPGPGVFSTVAAALASGFRRTLFLIAGIVLGDVIFLLLAVFGLATLARTLGGLFFAIKIAGGLYLIWLGVKIILAEPVPVQEDHRAAPRGRWRNFICGLCITLGNPKVILFYMGFLPTFMDLSQLTSADIFIMAGLIAVLLGATLSAYAWSASGVRTLFAGRQAVKNLNRTAGAVMVGAGLIIMGRDL